VTIGRVAFARRSWAAEQAQAPDQSFALRGGERRHRISARNREIASTLRARIDAIS